jgi:DNA mismatch endonuclease, patch repair protein
MMSGIRGKNTRPEMMVRRYLHRRGFRFKLHERSLPGSPDLVLPRHRVVIFVHGCFWHRHDCAFFKWPKTRPDFWREKVLGNVRRDEQAQQQLRLAGWRVATVWECATRGRDEAIIPTLDALKDWIMSDREEFESGPIRVG